nr:zinc finger CCCH domain-containing protein 3 isoform X1 [Tanacetum cinerariifolium]GEY92467.1 zinc finger CCCH domain-containing protein 3 isoform X1 [Tanacetum cinerariifolium]
MPLGKYYCDYCDKEFQDTPFHRKRHIQGIQHQRAKASWYSSIFTQTPAPALGFNHTSSPTPGVCNRFIRTGSCPYGDSCKYFHPSQNLQSNNQGFTAANSMNTHLPSFQMNQPIERSSLPGGMGGVMLGNLPPSLRPPPEGGYLSLPFVDWG